MTKAEQMAVDLIMQPGCEGCKLSAYLDVGGVPTIGAGTVKYPNGIAVKMGDTCTLEQAKEYLLDHLQKNVFNQVFNLCGANVPDEIYAALCSLGYNIGSALGGVSIVSAVKTKNWDALAAAFRKYNKVKINGVLTFSQGLANRREIEIKTFAKYLGG